MSVKVLSLSFILNFFLNLVVLVHAQGNDIHSSSSTSKGSKSLSTFACKDELNNNVDWFIAYKLPKLPQSADALFQEGSGYFYILPGNSKWERSTKAIHHDMSILGITTKPLYRNSTSSSMSSSVSDTELAYILYNDQPPNETAVVRDGHTKGVIFGNKDGGIWMPHSVPHFPIPGSSFGYPHGGLENGQMFFCLTLNPTQIDGIGNILKYTKPKIFNFSIPESLSSVFPTLLDVAQSNATMKIAPWYKTFQIGSKGLDVTVFAKGPKFRKEIYANWISPKYQTGLDVQSWLNGAHPFLSNCTSEKYQVLNILDKRISGQNFSTHNDHSKWAVGIDQPITCIGDLNRMKPQRTRGGVALCIFNKQVWLSFKAAVTDTQPCKKVGTKHSSRRNRNQKKSTIF